jgi:hypothetical protein
MKTQLVEKRTNMREVNGQWNPTREEQVDELLVACLRILFPDCEVKILSKRDDALEEKMIWGES